MNVGDALSRLPGYSHALLVVPDEEGYPLSVATSFRVVDGTVEVTPASTGPSAIRDTVEARLVVSHIRPYPGVGYDQRRYIELSGALSVGGPAWRFNPQAARGWDEQELSFPELCQRALPQARRYLAALSTERGREVKPQMSTGWRFFLATRLPFLTATVVPVFLGLAAAVYDRHFSLGLAALTLVGAMAVHLGLNVANDVFDTMSGVDDVNFTPTKFSGGSRVLQYGLVNMRQMMALAAVFYAVAIIVGLVLVAISGVGLLWLGVAGVLISFFYSERGPGSVRRCEGGEAHAGRAHATRRRDPGVPGCGGGRLSGRHRGGRVRRSPLADPDFAAHRPTRVPDMEGPEGALRQPLSADVLPGQERQSAPLHWAPALHRCPARDPRSPVTIFRSRPRLSESN